MFNSNYGEKFDGRLLFHKRRSEIHEEMAKWSIASMKDPKYLGEWCASLMQLHRMLWGSLGKVEVKVRNGNKEFKVGFNKYLEKKLYDIHKQILSSFTYNERGDGDVKISVNRDELKNVYFDLDKIQKMMGETEYKKNLDLPPIKDPKVAIEDFQ